MIPFTCPCCEVSSPPHIDGCTFHDDCPADAETFDEVSALRAEIARLREEQTEVVIPGPSCDELWLPDYARGHGRGFNSCRMKFIAALTKAGIKVKEVGDE